MIRNTKSPTARVTAPTKSSLAFAALVMIPVNLKVMKLVISPNRKNGKPSKNGEEREIAYA